MSKDKTSNKINIERHWEFDSNQVYETDGKKYFIHDALRLAKDLEVKELKISEMYIAYPSPNNETLRSFVMHMKMVNESDLDFPILMNQDGSVIDGRHRLAKALLEGHETIKVKRFDEDPADCFDWL